MNGYINLESEMYSTKETKIGKWIDGRTLYQKVVTSGSISTNTVKNISPNVSNLY